MVRGPQMVLFLLLQKKEQSVNQKSLIDFNQGYSQPARIPEMSNAAEYATIMNEIPIYKSIPVNEWGAAWTCHSANRGL